MSNLAKLLLTSFNRKLLKGGKTLYLAQEWRMNFNVATLSTEATCYSVMKDYVQFKNPSAEPSRDSAEETKALERGGSKGPDPMEESVSPYLLEAQQVEINFPQRVMPYTRVPELVLFAIRLAESKLQ